MSLQLLSLKRLHMNSVITTATLATAAKNGTIIVGRLFLIEKQREKVNFPSVFYIT